MGQDRVTRPEHEERIVTDPKVLVGKPVIKGTRIPVELVLAKLAQNPDLAELFADYPRLTLDDVKACLSYAKDLVERRGRPPHGKRQEAKSAVA